MAAVCTVLDFSSWFSVLLSAALPAVPTEAGGLARGTAVQTPGLSADTCSSLGLQAVASGHPLNFSSCVFLQSRQKEHAFFGT